MGELGRSAMLGERMWQRDLLVRLVIGPVRLPQFRRFLPGGAGAAALKQLLLLLTGASLAYEIKLTLDRRDVQPVTLHAGRAADQGRLGWDTFLTTKPSSEERDDVRYTIDFAQ
jgi:type VI secretion system protein ImpH